MKKYTILFFISLIVSVVAVSLYVRSDHFALKLRPLVMGPLQEVLGEDARIGRIRANFIPMYFEALDIVLPDDQGNPAVAVRRIKIYMNPLPLVFRTIRLPSIVLVEPRIHAERSGEGVLNLEPLVNRIRSDIARIGGGGPSKFVVQFKALTMKQGTVSYRDSGNGIQSSVSEINLTTWINGAGDRYALTVKNSKVQFAAAAVPPVTGTFKASLRYQQGRFHVDSAELATADTVVSLAGIVGAQPDPELSLRLQARSGPQSISRFISLLKRIKKEKAPHFEASATMQGTLSDPVVDGRVSLSGLAYQGLLFQESSLAFDYRDKRLTLAGTKWKLNRGGRSLVVNNVDASFSYSSQGFDIERLDVNSDDLSFTLSGRADPERGFDAAVAAHSRGKGKGLAFLTSVPVEGNIEVTGDVTGAFEQPLLDGIFSGERITVRGVQFESAQGKLLYGDRKIQLVSTDIRQGLSRFFLNGSIDLAGPEAVYAARLKVVRADVRSVVALFYEPLPLHITATGDLAFNGTSRDFTGNGRVTVDAGDAYGESFTRGIVTAVLSKEKIFFPHVSVEKGSGTVTGRGWIGFDQTYSAKAESRGVKLSQVDIIAGSRMDGPFDLTVESSGSFSLPQVNASLAMEDFSVAQTSLGNLNADLEIKDRMLTGKAKISQEKLRLSAKLGLTRPYSWAADCGFFSDLIDPLRMLGKKELAERVQANARGNLSLKGNLFDRASMTGSVLFQELGLVIGDYRIENDGPASLWFREDTVGINTLNFKGQNTGIVVTGSARLLKNFDFSILGKANLSLLRPLFRDLEYSDGSAEVKLAVRDEWKNPDIRGELIVKNGEIKLRDIQQRFSSLAGKLTFDRQGMVVDTLRGKFGGGTISASGRAELAGIMMHAFSSTVSFENVTVKYPEGMEATLSGDLYYDGDRSEQALTGDVAIKRARYEKRVEWKSMLVDLGKGLYQKKKTEAGWIGDTQINIRFLGTENILFQNNLAKIPLDVDVFLRGTVNHPQLLGRIEARKGSVYFRQNEFKILHGSADFIDPNRMNPVLDVQAEIRKREYLIRLAVSGTADRAVVTLLSDPALPDSDILALLALGKKGDELKGREAGVGMSEAASFATGRLQDMFESRARSLTGLDRFQVDPYISKGETSVPRVTLGKEVVQDKLYVTYSSNVGSAVPEQIFRVEYLLNKHFSVVGERNELGNTGADIKYRFEFR